MSAERVKELLLNHLVELSLTGVGLVFLALAAWANPYLLAIVDALPAQTTLWLLAIALALFVWSFAIYYFFKPKLIFEESSGAYKDKKTGLRYCASCRDAHKRLSPLRASQTGNGWYCGVKGCHSHFPNPKYKEPPDPPPEMLEPEHT